MAKKRFTAAQRRAYDTGKAYRLGRENKAITFKNEENRASFSAGYKAGGKVLSRYKDTKR